MRATWLEQEPGVRDGCPCGRMVRLTQAPSVSLKSGCRARGAVAAAPPSENLRDSRRQLQTER
jgi:hypothetical protein